MRKSPRLLTALIGLSLLLGACGAPPTIRESTLLAANVEKTGSLRFIYRNVEMKRTSAYSYGTGISAADMGFHDFGNLLASQAKAVFAGQKIAVVESRVMDGKDGIPLDLPPETATADGLLPAVLVVAPVSGVVNATRQATRASYVFSAQLFDPKTRRLVWKATIDTSTWAGQDFVMKNIDKTSYDDSYANQLLKAVAEQMKRDGII